MLQVRGSENTWMVVLITVPWIRYGKTRYRLRERDLAYLKVLLYLQHTGQGHSREEPESVTRLRGEMWASTFLMISVGRKG